MTNRLIYQPKGRAREYAPWALNLFRGCNHACRYCYAPTILKMDRKAFHHSATPRWNGNAQFWEQLEEEASLLSADIQLGLREPMQILLCFTCDPYPIGENGFTRSVIELLHRKNLPVTILSKGGERSMKDFDLLSPRDAYATTLTFLDAEQSERWEPGAAPPEERIDALRQAHQRGLPTWVSLEPVIDPQQTLALIAFTHPFVDFYKIGKLNYQATPEPVDWAQFAQDAANACRELQKPFLLKEDLRMHLGGGG